MQFKGVHALIFSVWHSRFNVCQISLQAVRVFDLWGMNCSLPGKLLFSLLSKTFRWDGRVQSLQLCPLPVHLATNTKRGGRVCSWQGNDSWNRLSHWVAVWDAPRHTGSPCLQPNSYKSPFYFRLWLPVTFGLRHRTQFIPQRGESTWDAAGRTCRDWSNNKLQSEHLFVRFSVSLLVVLSFSTCH